MHTEHHIDSFDLESFFKLHDLDLNGFWDVAEIEAVYGLHHHYVKERLPQKDLQDGRASVVVEKVLQKLDKDGDKGISLEEFLAGGDDGLPSFEGYKDLGRTLLCSGRIQLTHRPLRRRIRVVSLFLAQETAIPSASPTYS